MSNKRKVYVFRTPDKLKIDTEKKVRPYASLEEIKKCPLCGSKNLDIVQVVVSLHDAYEHKKFSDMCNDCGILFVKRNRTVWKCNFCTSIIHENDKICSSCKREIDWT